MRGKITPSGKMQIRMIVATSEIAKRRRALLRFDWPAAAAHAVTGEHGDQNEKITLQSANCAAPMTVHEIGPHSIANSAAMVRVETVRIKPEQGPGPAHVLRQRSGDIDRVPIPQRMRNDKAACMEVQLGFDA